MIKCSYCKGKGYIDDEHSMKEEVQVEINIYFNKFVRDKYISTCKAILSTYNRTNLLVHKDFEEKFNNYQEKLFEERTNVNYSELQDPSAIDNSDIIIEAGDYIDQELLMQYQFHFSTLVNLYQVFEQQIRKLLYKELNHSFSKVQTKDELQSFATKFGDIKKVLKELNYPLGNISSWSIIDELNKIANTYKHGDGNSAKSLFRKNKEVFVNRATRYFYYDQTKSEEEENLYIKTLDEDELKQYRKSEEILIMKEELTTINEIVLRSDKTPLEKYVNAIIDLWEVFPYEYRTKVKLETS